MIGTNKGTLVYVKSDKSSSGKELALLLFDIEERGEEEEESRPVRVSSDKHTYTDMSMSEVGVMLGVPGLAKMVEDSRPVCVFTNTRGYMDLPLSDIEYTVGTSSLAYDLTGLYGLYDALRTEGDIPLYHTPLGKFSFEAQSSDVVGVETGSTVVIKRFVDVDGTFYVLLGSVVSMAGTEVGVDVGLPEPMRFDVSDLAVVFS